MISKTKINRRIGRKSDPNVIETIVESKKHSAWNKISQLLSSSRRNYSSVNLKKIEENTSEGDTILIPGKVLGSGELTKKVRICAMSFSDSAREKMKRSKSEAVFLVEEIKKNPKAEGVKILR